jgi:hypothetical protein
MLLNEIKTLDTLLAPNGQPSNLNQVQYYQVRTPEFKQWFGDWEKTPNKASKVLDTNGEPMVVYHGTGTEFYVFDKKKANDAEGRSFGVGTGKGVFAFTTDKDIAGIWANRASSRSEHGVMHDNPNTMAVFLNIRNPITRDHFGEMLDKKFEGYQFRIPKYRDRFIAEIYKELKSSKVDGIISDFGEITAFNPNQIKSATHNFGTFSKKSKHIHESLTIDDGKYRDFKFQDTTIQYANNGQYIKIASVRTPVSKRGQGSARAAMVEFLKLSDALNIPTMLDSSGLDKKTNDLKLLNFYKSLGYAETGRTINIVGDKELLRKVP